MKRKSKSSSTEKYLNKKKMDIGKESSQITKSILEEYEVKPDSAKRAQSSSQEKNKESAKKDEIWGKSGNVLFKGFNGFKGSKKIVSFDLDDTLITPSDDKKFSKGDSDWIFAYDIDVMKKKIKEFIDKDYSICIFSNQSGITKGQTQEGTWKKKVDSVMKQLNVPIMVFAALEKDYYRKPSIGMLDLLETKYNNNLVVDKKNSIYVGDAAGRINNYQKKAKKQKDFSDSDYKFALNAGLQFKTPEEFFLDDKKQEIPSIDFDLHQYDKNTNAHIKYDDKTPEMIILIGSPGSGKSTFTENTLVPKGYVRVNQDTLKTEKKCLQVAEEALSKGSSCVIDSTNPKQGKRKVYIDLAKKLKVQVRCFIMQISKDFAFHLNNLRNIDNERKHYSSSVNDIPIHTFYKYYEEPTVKEGIDEVVKVNFIPGPFKNNKDKEIFYMHS